MKTNQDWQDWLGTFLGEDFLSEFEAQHQSAFPDTDVYETKQEMIVVMNIPGVTNVRDIKTKLVEQSVLVEGRLTSPYQGYESVVSERRSGLFRRKVDLPVPVHKRNYTARYRRGVLELRFVKK